MRDYINIYNVRVSLLLLLAAVLLAACSDDADTAEVETDVLQLVAYAQGKTDVEPTATRADLPGYHEYKGPSSIGVYATSAEEAPASIRTFNYAVDQWRSLVNVKNDETYYIYGYMPASADVHCNISKREGEDMKYSHGAVLSFPELPPVLGEDFCVVAGVQQLINKTDEVNLTPGVFTFTGKQTGKNFACLMLDHLYSCVKFSFKVSEAYDKLRTIKLTKVELKTTQQISYPLVVTMKAGEGYTVDLSDDATPRSNVYMKLSIEEGGVPLSTTVKEVAEGYFVPKSDVAENLVLRCTYDIYDKNVTEEQPEGNLVRQNCVAENKLPTTIVAGTDQRTLLTLTVTPTYLYVLSEPDLDNPTIVVK